MNDDLPAVVGHDSPALRQAESESTARFAATKEWIKYMPPHLCGDAGPVVADDNFNPRSAADVAPPNRNRNAAPFVDRLNRIFHNSVQRHAQLRFIGTNFAGQFARRRNPTERCVLRREPTGRQRPCESIPEG